MKPLPQRLNVSRLRHLEGWVRGVGGGQREEGSPTWERHMREGENDNALIQKWGWCLCQAENNRVIRMKCFPTLACLSWLFFPPDNSQVTVCVFVCTICLCQNARSAPSGARRAWIPVRVLQSCLFCVDTEMSTDSWRGWKDPHTHGSYGCFEMFRKHKVNQVLPPEHAHRDKTGENRQK